MKEKSELSVKICRVINILFTIRPLSNRPRFAIIIIYKVFPTERTPCKRRTAHAKDPEAQTHPLVHSREVDGDFFRRITAIYRPSNSTPNCHYFLRDRWHHFGVACQPLSYCGTFFRGGEWSKPHAGYCNKCGKLMEYDDTVAEREYLKNLKEN